MEMHDKYGLMVGMTGIIVQDDIRLIPFIQSRGYLQVSFNFEGKTYKRLVHRLVAEVYLGLNDGQVVSFRDENKMNVAVSNLIVHSRGEAMALCGDRGSWSGVKHWSKLTVEQVWAIRSEHPVGASVDECARDYGVSKSTIQKILNGRNWINEH